MSDKESSTERRLGFAISLNLLAFLCFATMDTSAKWLVTTTMTALQVTWLRYLFHFMWVLVLYLPTHGSGLVRSKIPVQQAFRGSLLLLGTLLNFAALHYLPLTVTIAIFFSTPLIVCLLSIPILGETVGIRRLSAVFVGFCGVLVIVAPWNAKFDPHIFLSLFAALTVSGYFVMSRRVAGVDSNAIMQFYTSGIATVLLTPAVFFIAPMSADIGIQSWLVAAMVGSLGMLGHSMITRAHRHAEASVLAPTVYSQAIYIVIFSWFLFDQAPNVSTSLGTLIIIASGLYLWVRENREAKT